jgi:carbon storage regulator
MLGGPVVGIVPVANRQRKVHRLMLVLTRKSNQSIMIGDEIEVSVLSVMGEKVRIGIQAPQKVPVFRKEIYLEIHREAGAVTPERDRHARRHGSTVEGPVDGAVDASLRKLGDST